MVAALIFPPLASLAWTTANSEVDGGNDVSQVYGSLMERICRLEMGSTYQEMGLGETSSARLRKAGDRDIPVEFSLCLHDCLQSPSRSHNQRSGNLLWCTSQSAVSVSFAAPMAPVNPALVALRGRMVLACGLAMGVPILLTPGGGELVYQVTPELPPAVLIPRRLSGADGRLNYN